MKSEYIKIIKDKTRDVFVSSMFNNKKCKESKLIYRISEKSRPYLFYFIFIFIFKAHVIYIP